VVCKFSKLRGPLDYLPYLHLIIIQHQLAYYVFASHLLAQVSYWLWMGFCPRLRRCYSKFPFPEVSILLIHRPFNHVNNILSDDWHEFKSMSRASCGNIKVGMSGIRADSEVHVFGVAVPLVKLLACKKDGATQLIDLTLRRPRPVCQLWYHVADKFSHFFFNLS
jgi:hypothetical protein